MIKLFLLAFCLAFMACNNSSETSDKSAKKDAKVSPRDSITDPGELSFIDGCVDNAKGRLGEAQAFVYCKCFMLQAKAKFGAIDSTTMMKLEKDTAQIAKMAKDCQ
jgi:hypothetical protein